MNPGSPRHPSRISLDFCSFFFSSRRRHTRSTRDWSSDVCSSDLRRSTVATGAILDGPPMVERLCQLLAVDLDPLTLEAHQAVRRGEQFLKLLLAQRRSEERRVGKECRSRWSPYR